MPVEAFIEDPLTGERFAYEVLAEQRTGHLFCSYPDGPGNFEARVVKYTGNDTAEVYEVKDGNTLELSYETTAYLPSDARVVQVDEHNSYREEVVSPQGIRADLVVRSLIEIPEQ